jgi:hypothetical protein
MEREPMGTDICGVCREREAVDICRGCGVALCRKCRRVELGRTRGEEEVEVLVFCSECSERLKEQHGEGEEAIFDLERIADMVNQGSQKVARFKIRLKP